MAQTEGLRGMFKGNGANVVRIVPNSAVKFLTYEHVSKRVPPPNAAHRRRPRCPRPLARVRKLTRASRAACPPNHRRRATSTGSSWSSGALATPTRS